jgi:hypothetical protein
LEDYKHDKTTERLTHIQVNFSLTQKILKGLNVELQYQYAAQEKGTDRLADVESFFARDLINLYTKLSRTSAPDTFRIPRGGILDRSNSNLTSHSGRIQVNFDRKWSIHSLSALAGFQVEDSRTTSSLFREYGYNGDILSTVPVNYTNSFPNFITGSPQSIPYWNSLGAGTTRFVSVYANAGYSYRNRYTASASARRDASNTFGVNINDKWTPLWSAGLGWDISKEQFYRVKTLPYLKFSITYGYSGNVDPSRTAATTINYIGPASTTLFPNAIIDRYYNPDLRWEKTAMMNLRLDFKFANNKISGSIEHYRKKCTDLYGTTPIDYTVGLGVSNLIKNVASMQSNGWDFSLKASTGRSLKWTGMLNLSLNKNKITQYYNPFTTGSFFVGSGGQISGIVDRPVYSLLSYYWGGLDPATGDPLGYFNGQLGKNYSAIVGPTTTINDLKYQGSADPTIFGNIVNTIEWKGISLSAAIQYKFGHYFRKPALNYTLLFSGSYGGGSYQYANRWQKPGDENSTNVPSLIYPLVSDREAFYSGTEIHVEKADHIRLAYINLGYNLEREKMRWLPLKNMQLYLNFSNLGIVWKATDTDFDPNTGGIPASATISFGIRGNF